jgi:hypothetical protein
MRTFFHHMHAIWLQFSRLLGCERKMPYTFQKTAWNTTPLEILVYVGSTTK